MLAAATSVWQPAAVVVAVLLGSGAGIRWLVDRIEKRIDRLETRVAYRLDEHDERLREIERPAVNGVKPRGVVG